MPAAKNRLTSVLEFVALFAAAYLISHFLFGGLWGNDQKSPQTGIAIEADGASLGNVPAVTLKNATATGITLKSRCPLPPFDLFKVTAGGTGETLVAAAPTEIAGECPPDTSIAAGQHATITLTPWKYALFSEEATYEVRLPEDLRPLGGTGHTLARLEMTQPNGFVKLFRTFISQPFLNLFVGIAALLPGHNLGLTIILLTLLIKLLLFLPTQHALQGQRKMQVLQPKMNALREKHKNDAATMQREMMALWKEHNVNPFQSCLPLLVQFPILIGLYYVIRDGSQLEFARESLYPIFQSIDWSFSPWFLGMDLSKPLWVFAPILMGLQFLQMWLSFKQRKTEKKNEVIDSKTGKPTPSAEETQQKIMLYALPLMIGFFAIQFPAAVSLYWGVSTLFAIVQQVVVNRKVG